MLPIINNSVAPAFILPGMGLPELIIILVIVLIIFGPKKLPDMGKAIGQSIRELKKATDSKKNLPRIRKNHKQIARGCKKFKVPFR